MFDFLLILKVSGAHLIIDMDGLPLSHVTHFTPSFAAASVEFVQRCVPCRLKGIHIINQPFIFNLVFAFFKPFFNVSYLLSIILQKSLVENFYTEQFLHCFFSKNFETE